MPLPVIRRHGFTLIELLVVIAIIAILIGLLLPAVQRVRESASRTQCQNHLKQLTLSANAHLTDKGRYPTSGTYPWQPASYIGGVPDESPNQEAGWGFQLLPFMEQYPLYRVNNQTRLERTPINFYFCPSRRKVAYHSTYLCALNDYAAATPGTAPGANVDTDFWQQGSGERFSYATNATYHNVFVRARTRYVRVNAEAVTDGTSNVMILGEKSINTANYTIGDWHDDRGWSDGFDPDIVRFTARQPRRDAQSGATGYEFGSAHPGGFNAGFADGSVRVIRYNVEPVLFNFLADRRDGRVLKLSDL